MALTKPQGKLVFTKSPSEDVVAYVVFQSTTAVVDYNSPNAVVTGIEFDEEGVGAITLPVPGLPAVEGLVKFGIAAQDQRGNLADIVAIDPVLIDVTPPAPVSNVEYVAF